MIKLMFQSSDHVSTHSLTGLTLIPVPDPDTIRALTVQQINIMNIATQLLEPYKEVIGQVCGIVSIGQMLSGAFLLNDIRKRGKTGADDSVVPFLGGAVL